MNMKKYAMILVAISMSFVSCEKWLDLQQEGEITASQLYGKGEGYRCIRRWDVRICMAGNCLLAWLTVCRNNTI